MKASALISSRLFHVTGLAHLVFLFLLLPLTTPCLGASQTNSIPWNDNFENYTDLAPLVNGTNGWFASSTNCIVQTTVFYTGTKAAMLPIDITLSNRFIVTNERIVRLEMYVKPQLYDGTNYPAISGTNYSGVSTNVAAQFIINSNGYFVIGNGTNWNEATNMADGNPAIAITNTYFTRIQINLRYRNHTWNLKAWTNGNDLVANTYYVNFTSNLNTFSGFDIYNGNSTSYVDDVSVTNIGYNLLPSINGVPIDNIRSINGAPPTVVNGVRIDR